MKEKQIILFDLPKVSLNSFYESKHWSHRKKIKDVYSLLLRNHKDTFSKENVYEVEYLFEFKKNALDASNTIGMVKLIEDIIFEDDKWDIILSIKTSSRKAKIDKLTIIVKNNGNGNSSNS